MLRPLRPFDPDSRVPHPFIRSVPLALPLSFLLTWPLSGQEVTARPTLAVAPVSAGVHIDGRLDEPVWMEADSIPALTMTEPVEGGATVGRTVVRVLADADALYVGIVAYDPEPGAIVSFSKQRDPSLNAEDHVVFVLDTFLDGRSGYTFAVNPTGARYDALVSGAGERQSADWDGIWEARTTRGDRGWSAEFRIPVRTLSFRPGLTEWGFNVQRQVQRLQETSRWSSPRRDYQITQVSRAGRLTGLPDFRFGVGVSVRPAVVAGASSPAPGAELDGTSDASLDVTQRLGGNLLASLTVNTDFAETDVDTRQTNLTRFALLFPEKRAFFLEGSDIFSFGFGTGQDLLPFQSRRLGLVSGRPVPIDLGAKLSGRSGDTNVGLLAVRTGVEDGVAPASTMTVARVRQNVLRESSVGILATTGDPRGRDGAWTAGTDLTYRTSTFFGDKNFIAAAWGLATRREGLVGERSAWGLALDYPNDLWDIYASYKRVGDGFDPSLGFVPRPGIQAWQANLTWLPRPGWSWLRYMRNELFLNLVTDLDGAWESYRIFTAPLNWRFESGDRLELNWAPEGERLPDPFEIADGVVIPAGSYHWHRYRIEAQFADKRRVSGQFSWWFGDFYEGTLDQYSARMSIKPSASYSVDFTSTRNVGRLPQGDFVQGLFGTRLRVNVSPDLQVSAFVQYDNESKQVGSNTRLRWTFDPSGDLFVVYNHNLQDIGDRWQRQSNELLVKVQYALRR
jgi:hypothetical protein